MLLQAPSVRGPLELERPVLAPAFHGPDHGCKVQLLPSLPLRPQASQATLKCDGAFLQHAFLLPHLPPTCYSLHFGGCRVQKILCFLRGFLNSLMRRPDGSNVTSRVGQHI